MPDSEHPPNSARTSAHAPPKPFPDKDTGTFLAAAEGTATLFCIQESLASDNVDPGRVTAPSDRQLEQILARRLRQIAAQRKLPLSHVADRAGIARSHLWALLNAERSATLALIQRLAVVLEVAPVDLLSDADAPAKPASKRDAKHRKPERR